MVHRKPTVSMITKYSLYLGSSGIVIFDINIDITVTY